MRFLAAISLFLVSFAAVGQSCLPPMIVQTGGSNPTCPGSPVTLDAGAGASYLWSNGATTRSITVTPSTAETLTVAVTDAEGCEATSAPLTINVQPSPTPTISPSHDPICPLTASQATVVPPQGMTYVQYLWSILGATVTGTRNEASVAFTAGSTPVTLSVWVLDSNGCAAQRSIILPIRTITYSAISLSRTQSCPNTALTAGIASQSGFTYAWTVTNGTLTSSATAPNIAFTTGASGTTSVSCVVTDPQGCKVTKTANVTIRSMTLSSTASATACLVGTSNYSASVTNPSGYSGFSWSVSSNATIVSGGTSATMTYRVNNAGPVTLTATANDSVGTCPSTASITRQNGNTPEPIVSFESTVVCSLGQARFTVDNAAAFTGGVTVAVTNGSATKVGPATWEYTPSRPAPANMTISVTGRMSAGCPYVKSFVVPVDNPPSPTVTLAPNCPLGVMRLTSSPAARYEWTTSPAGVGTRTDQTYDMTSPGTYQLVAWNQNECPATFGPKSVTSVPIPAPTILAGGPTTICEGGSVTLTPSTTGLSYGWKRNGVSISSARILTATQSGTYTVTVSDNFCTQTSAPVTVTVEPRPILLVTANGPLTFCSGGSVTLTAASGDGSIRWSNGATTPSITVNASGTYTATVTAENGCTASQSKTVTVTTPPSTITASGPTTLCPGGSVTLTAPESASYSWWTGEHTRSITVTNAGSYRVTVTDAAGCRATSAPVDVTLSEPNADFTLPAAFCLPGSLQLSALFQPNSTYTWSASGPATITPATGSPRHATLSFLGAGDVSVTLTVTAASGCSVTRTRTVSAEAAPSIAASSLTFCPDQSVTLVANPANAASYLWSNGATTRQISVSTAGEYGVTVTTAGGCTATVPPVTVTATAMPAPELVFPTICADDTDFDVTLTNASAYSSWFFTSNAAQIQPYGGATQHFMRAWHQATWVDVQVWDASGCSRHQRIDLPELPASDATITTSAPSFVAGETYTASVPDAGPGAQYAWDVSLATVLSGAGTRTITIQPVYSNGNPAHFAVTITGANGCAATNVKSVPVSEAP